MNARYSSFRYGFLIQCLLLLGLSSVRAQSVCSVYFISGSSRLNAAATRYLDSLFYRERLQGTTIRIYGYADEPGGQKINNPLSEERAQAVRTYLLQSGIRPEQIRECRGKGHAEGHGVSMTERRADLLVDRPEMSTPVQPVTANQLEDISRLQENQTLALQDLLFEPGTSHVLPASLPVLNQLLEVLKKHPGLEICLEGHICCQAYPGDGEDLETHTNDLSERRARAVYHYLVRNGIPASRLSYKGLGNAVPRKTPELTEEDQAQNRRVEVRVIKNG